MILRIEHSMRYRYSRSVYLEPYVLRCTPRSDGAQVLKSFELQIAPKPRHQSQCTDLDGIISHTLHFAGSHDDLHIVTRAVVETLRTDPYDFLLLDAAFSCMPLAYPRTHLGALHVYLQRAEVAPEVDSFTREIERENRDCTLEFLAGLTRRIHQCCRDEYRETGAPRRPAETLALARGSCRDLAALWIDSCRAGGFAARFVSGYKLGEEETDFKNNLHAWGEVYLPGGGWRGFDPSSGLAVAERHVALAAAADPALTAPGQGTLRGEATSDLVTNVSVAQVIE